MTEPTPPSEVARELFAAARREVPRGELRARTLSTMIAASQAHPQRGPIVLPAVLPLLAAAAGMTFFFATRSAPPTLDITAEPVVAVSTPATSASTAVSVPVPRPSGREVAPPASERPPTPSQARTPAPAAVPALSLSAEIQTLDRVRSALDQDPARALALLDTYDRVRDKRLGAEAQLLRMEALVRAGRNSEARALAQGFVAAHPGSPLVDRARSFLASESP